MSTTNMNLNDLTLLTELSLLEGRKGITLFDNSVELSQCQKLMQCLNCGLFEDLLKTSVWKKLTGAFAEIEQLDSRLLLNIEAYLQEQDEGNLYTRQLELLSIAVALLQLFVQNNWTGPPTNSSLTAYFPSALQDQEEQLREKSLSGLSCDGCSAYHLCRYPEYLYISKLILFNARHHFTLLQTSDWWLLRCLAIQQRLLDEKSPTLKSTCMELLQAISKNEPLMTHASYQELPLQFHLEAGQLCYTFYEYKLAREYFDTAKKISGLRVEFTGILGKRTRFQQENKSQLVLKVTTDTSERQTPDLPPMKSEPWNSTDFPKDVPLQDDIVFDGIQFADTDSVQDIAMSSLDAVFLIAFLEDHRRRQAEEEILHEELKAIVNHLLPEPVNWCVHVMALYYRSTLEKMSSRRVERSMMQIEELSKCIQHKDPDVCKRLPYFHTTNIPSSWTVQKELANLLLSLGAVSAAIQVLERLHLWEDVIVCYQRLGKTEQAESLIREQLTIKETPNLYCYLGDITRKIEHYEKAWELSNHRSARAQKCMAYLYMNELQHEKSLECFEKSLHINSLQVPVWFTYGCAAMAAKQYQRAATAFQRCVMLDYDNFEAWSNLSTAYVKLNQKMKAFLTLQDAIRCSFDNWRLWENSLIIGTDVGQFADVIQAYNRLMDIKDKWIDTEVLGILVRAITENMLDGEGLEAGRLKPKVMELFGRVTSKVTSNADIWRLYADLTAHNIDDSPETHTKVLQYLRNAHRSATQVHDWEKDADKCKTIGLQTVRLAQTYLSSVGLITLPEQKQMLSSGKLMVRGVVTAIRQHQTDPVSKSLREDLHTVCSSLDEELATITNKINQLGTT